jgi:TatD DNase family protein
MDIFVDTHCHINHPDYGDLPKVLVRAREAGVNRLICAGYDIESSVTAAKLAREIHMVYAAVGIHPYDAPTLTPAVEDQLRKLAEDRERVVAIGETGLDYFRAQTPPDVQQESFRRHIRMAHELSMPLIVHSRDAQGDVLSILEKEGIPAAGAVMHCLPADRDFAVRAANLGCYLGIAGQITFRNGQALKEIVADLPIDHLILETDSPYLTPHPHRGERNEPSYIPLIAAGVAEVKGMTVSEVASATTANARRLFGLEL